MAGKEIGRIGQKRYQGIFYEEFVPELVGKRGAEVYKEMSNNDDVCGAILFAMEMLMRQCDFNVSPGGKAEADKQAAQFVEECLNDMEYTWTNTLSEILTFLPYGWSYHEIVYKIRNGRSKNKGFSSKYSDGLIGWKKLPIRSQDTLFEWRYDENTDDLLGMVQSPPPNFEYFFIPIEKALHFTTNSIKANPEGKSIFRNAYRCFDEETEILTETGWKKGIELSEYEKIATLNAETGMLEYQEAKEIHKYHHSGEMIRFHSKFIDICVTEGHRMYVKKDKSEKYEIVLSENVKKSHSIKRFAGWEGKKVDIHTINGFDIYQTFRNGERKIKEKLNPIEISMDDWIPFLALFLSEGCTTITKRGQRIVIISQKECERSDKMREIFSRLPFHFYEHKHDGKIAFEFYDVRLFNELSVFGKSKDKYVPSYIKQLTREQIHSFLEWYVFGDGAIVGNTKGGYEGTKVITTISSIMSDDIQELAIKAGYESQISIRKNNHNDLYIISICNKKNHKIKCIERVDYDGIVWCPTTENGIVYVRKNGKPAWVGNCWYFKKRIQEIEGIGIERDLAGFPLLEAPENYERLWDPNDQDMVTTLQNATAIVSGIRRDEREGLVLPPGWKLTLVSTGSRRQFDTNQIIERYDKRMATTVLADFIFMGQQAVGSFALSDNKTELFSMAVGTYLDIICEVFNNQAIPRLIDINGDHFKGITDYPTLEHGDIEKTDIEKFATFLEKMIGNGVIVPDEEIEDEARRIGGLPERQDGVKRDYTQQAEENTDGPKKGEETEYNNAEAQSIYKIISILEKYSKGSISRNIASSMLNKIGCDKEETETYLSDAENQKEIMQREAAAKEQKKQGNKPQEENPPSEEDIEDEKAAEEAKKIIAEIQKTLKQIRKRESFVIYRVRDGYIIHNEKKPFPVGHTHIRNFDTAKYIVNISRRKTVPKNMSRYLLNSLIRLTSDTHYKKRLENELIQRKGRNMKRYIGTKIIEAKPGTMAEAQALKYGCPVETQKKIFQESGTKDREGYIVKYPDGYISFSPKEVFEEAYRECGGVTFGLALEAVKKGKGMRLPQWKPDVVIRAQFPDEHSKMTAPYLYVESRFGRVPWKETMIELFSDEWEIVE